MKKIYLIIVLSVFSTICNANDFSYKISIDTITENGFYKIILTPEIIAELNSDYSDIRLYDAQNNEIPYILNEESFSTQNRYFSEFPIIENTTVANGKTTRIVIENPGKKLRSEIRLYIRNTDLQREITLKGSDDKKSWYTISKGYPDYFEPDGNDSAELRVFSFPPSNYAYFELTMRNKHNDKFQVIRVGYVNQESTKGSFSLIPAPVIKQVDSIKNSYITLCFNKPYIINRIEWQIKGPAFFLRNTEFGKYNKSKGYPYFEQAGYSQFSSKYPAVWDINSVKTDTLTVIVHNKDNPAIKVMGCSVYQLNVYLIANLQKDNTYHFLFGNRNIQKPEYDLSYFTDQIPKELKVIGLQNIITIKTKLVEQTQSKSPFLNKYFLWSIILLVSIVMIYISVKLLKDFNK